MKAAHVPYFLGAALFVALVGIGVNALLLQRERHPAPLFESAPRRVLRAAPPAATLPPRRASEENAPPAPSSAARPPARLVNADNPSAAPSDPIADFLNGDAHSDASRMTLAAQTALAKLGYPVRPDGDDGPATEQALRNFERAHRLPPATGITRRLVRELTAAARAAGR